MPLTAAQSTKSAAEFVRLAFRGDLKLVRQRIGKRYSLEDGTYTIFRETPNNSATGKTCVLVIGFRLKLIKSYRVYHWLFQRVCILTTSFWSGVPGFKTKLWMVDLTTKNYLDFLLPILRFFSVPGSVWAKQIVGKDFESFLASHLVNS